jgi:uncharacterized cupin superfamily protein
MQQPDAAPVVHRRSSLESDAPGVRSRLIGAEPGPAWQEPVAAEWELHAAGWQDCHPYTELNVVLEGRLHVESGGVEVVLDPGDSVVVAAGSTGRYWAPEHARMLSVYGPNPEGRPTVGEHGWTVTPGA